MNFMEFFSSARRLSLLGAVMLSLLMSCKSDVEDQTHLVSQNTINVDSLAIQNQQAIREQNAQTSVIKKKYYAIKACLSENALGTKLDRRRIEATGAPLLNNLTDAGGCIFWEHTFDLDYSGAERCKVISKTIKVPSTGIQKELRYAIDTITDDITDLSRGRGCLIQAEENVSANVKNDGGKLILDKVYLTWTGETQEKRSDVATLEYQTRVESCVKARVTGDPLSFTAVEITIKAKDEKLHGPLTIPVTTNDKGCFIATYLSPYHQFEHSHWLEKDFSIEIKSGPLKDTRAGTTLYVNPYEPSRLFFGNDKAWDPPPLENPLPYNNRIHIDGVMYVQIGNDQNEFKVNDYLGLTVSKSYQVVLTPRLDLGHRFQKDKPRYVKMHDGKFRLKFMLLAPNKADIDINEGNFSNYTYITGAEKIVDLKDGVINSRMNIPVRLSDLPRLAVRAVTVFKLEPIDENIGLRETLVTGYFKAKIAWIKTNVFQSEVLQEKEESLEDKYLSHLPEAKRQELLDQRAKGDRDIVEGLTPEQGQAFILDGEGEEDLKKLEYKRFIENLFSQIGNYEKTEIYGNPKIFEEDSPKGIFVRHLKHTYPEILVGKTKYEADEYAMEMINDDVELPKGIINKLYDSNKTKQLNKKEDRYYKALMAKLCRRSFPKPEKKEGWLGSVFGPKEHPEYNRCIKNPESFFETSFIMHAHKVDKATTKNSNGLRIHVGSTFATSSSVGETEYLSKRVGVDGGLKFPFGEFFGLGVRLFDVSYTWSESESYNANNSDNVGFSKEIIGESFTLEVKGLFEKCALVRGKEYLPLDALNNSAILAGGMAGGGMIIPRQLQRYNKKLEANYYICDEPVKTAFDEKWYYIQDYVPSATLLRDAYGPTEIKLIKVFRGESTLRELKKIFEDETKVYMATRTNNVDTPDVKLYENWGHLLKDPPPPSVANKLLINNFEGSFPGTVQ